MKLIFGVFLLAAALSYAANNDHLRTEQAKPYPTSDSRQLQEDGLRTRGPSGENAEDVVKSGALRNSPAEKARKQSLIKQTGDNQQ